MKSKLTKRILAVVITAVALSVLLALSSLAAITGGYGYIDGLEDGKNYEAAEVTLNSTGDGTAIGTPFALNATTNKDLAGLYVVRETGTTDWSDVLYVYGPYSERAELGAKVIDNHGLVRPETKALAYKPENINKDSDEIYYNLTWTPGMYSGYRSYYASSSAYKRYFSRDWGNRSSCGKAGDLKAALDSGNTDKVTEIRTQYQQLLQETAVLRYSYAANEIVPVNELLTMKFGAWKTHGGVTISSAKMKLVLYVVDNDGKVNKYTWVSNAYTPSNSVSTEFTVDIQSIDSLPEEGWVIAFDFYPAGVVELGDITSTTATNNATQGYEFGVAAGFRGSEDLESDFYVSNSSDLGWYVVAKPEKMEAPIGITTEGTTFKGLNKNMTYTISPYTILGADSTNRVTVTGVESYDLTEGFTAPGGLYGIYIAGGEYYADSDATLVYIMNKFSDMSNLGEYVSATDKTPVRAGTKEAVLEWKPGTYLAASYYGSDAFRANDMYYACSPKALYAALQTPDTADETALRQSTLESLQKISTRYAYTSNEIIPISQVKMMRFARTPQNITTYLTDVKSKLELHVMHEDGSVTVHSALGKEFTYKANNYDINNESFREEFDIQAIAGLPTDGWLVGFKYYPVYDVALANINPVNSTSTATVFSMWMRVPSLKNVASGYYQIEQAKLDAPTGITVEGTVFKGLDEKVTYAIAPYTIAGADANNMHEVSDVTEFDLTSVIPNPAGLYALVIPGDEYYKESAPTLVYIAGSSEMRKDIGIDKQFECEGFIRDGYETYYTATNKTYDRAWVPGLYSGYRNYYSAGGGYHFFVCDWYGRGSVKSAADLKAALATEDPSDELEIREGYKAFLQKQVLRYTYLSEEIIPVDEIFTMTFSPFKQHGAVTAAVKAKLILYVMDENGAVTEHSVVGSKYTPGSSATGQKFDVQAIEGLPSEGWVVGFEFMPAAEVELEDITSTSESTAAGLEIAIIWSENNYIIKEEAPTPSLSSFPVIPGGYGEISGLDATVLYEYQSYDEYTDTWSEWAPIPAGATAFRVTKSGSYRIRARETDDNLASVPAEISVLDYDPEYPSFDSQIVTMHLPNDFVELTAEYEIDVTVKNWVSTLALENIKTVAPKSTITISGEGYKFIIVAEKIYLDDTKAHYIDMTVSFDGESRFDTDYEGLKALAGDKYVTEVYFESSVALPFEEAQFWVFVGDDMSGNDVQLRSYNKRINKLRNVETATVIDGWATFSNYALTYVIIEK